MYFNVTDIKSTMSKEKLPLEKTADGGGGTLVWHEQHETKWCSDPVLTESDVNQTANQGP